MRIAPRGDGSLAAAKTLLRAERTDDPDRGQRSCDEQQDAACDQDWGTLRRRAPSHPPGAAGGQYRQRPSHVPRRSRRPGSRRLHARHRLANTRAPARLIPGTLSCPRFRCRLGLFDTSTAVRLRSPSWSPPDTSPGAFSSSLTTTVFSQRSMRRFDASPEGRRRRATTFITRTAPHQEGLPTHTSSPPRSWHTTGRP